MKSPEKYSNEITFIYNTSDRQAYFKFNIIKTGQIYEIDIIETPEHLGKSISSTDTHQSISNRGGYKICFGNPNVVTDIDKAREFSGEWAELAWKNLQTGEAF